METTIFMYLAATNLTTNNLGVLYASVDMSNWCGLTNISQPGVTNEVTQTNDSRFYRSRLVVCRDVNCLTVDFDNCELMNVKGSTNWTGFSTADSDKTTWASWDTNTPFCIGIYATNTFDTNIYEPATNLPPE